MEYLCAGDLSVYITKNSCLSTKLEKIQKLSWAKNIIRQVIQALSLIHSMGYVYRDLKPSNLLVSHEGIDFSMKEKSSFVTLVLS